METLECVSEAAIGAFSETAVAEWGNEEGSISLPVTSSFSVK
jgi:hypothetical protein